MEKTSKKGDKITELVGTTTATTTGEWEGRREGEGKQRKDGEMVETEMEMETKR